MTHSSTSPGMTMLTVENEHNYGITSQLYSKALSAVGGFRVTHEQPFKLINSSDFMSSVYDAKTVRDYSLYCVVYYN